VTEFTIRTEKTDEATTITVAGDLDMAVSPELRDVLTRAIEARAKRIVVNLKDITMMDSSGIAVLIEALRNCRKSRLGLALSSPSAPVKKVLELARLDEGIFEILNP